KAHVATDLQGIVQAVDFTAAKVPDNQRLEGLLTGEESVVLADRGYDYPQVHAALADRGIENAVARRRYPGQKTGLAALKRYNRAIARIRATCAACLWLRAPSIICCNTANRLSSRSLTSTRVRKKSVETPWRYPIWSKIAE
ncbi:transposase, partial [Acidithiobacillus caldus]